MKGWKIARILVSFAVTVPLLAGCGASLQARSVDTADAFLVNPNILEKGGPDQALYRYVNKAVDFKKYNKVLIDPVLIYREGELDADQRANFEKLAHNLYVYLAQDLGKDYKIVQTHEPGTLRWSAAIVSADKTAVVRNVLTTIIPVGVAISTVQYAATGKPSATGDITVEARVTDAVTGQLLAMGIDKQVGGKTLKGMTDSWYSADEGAKAIAKMIRYNACKLHGVPGADCNAIKP